MVKCPLLSSAHPDAGHGRGPLEHGASIWGCGRRLLQAEWLAASTSPEQCQHWHGCTEGGDLVRRREGGGPGPGTAGAKAKEQTAW